MCGVAGQSHYDQPRKLSPKPFLICNKVRVCHVHIKCRPQSLPIFVWVKERAKAQTNKRLQNNQSRGSDPHSITI